jgi:hypothetical protein
LPQCCSHKMLCQISGNPYHYTKQPYRLD